MSLIFECWFCILYHQLNGHESEQNLACCWSWHMITLMCHWTHGVTKIWIQLGNWTTTLMNSFLSSKRFSFFFFLAESFGFSVYQTLPSANRVYFNSSFPFFHFICLLFLFYVWLLQLESCVLWWIVMTSVNIFAQLFLILKEKFFPLIMMLAASFLFMTFTILR